MVCLKRRQDSGSREQRAQAHTGQWLEPTRSHNTPAKGASPNIESQLKITIYDNEHRLYMFACRHNLALTRSTPLGQRVRVYESTSMIDLSSFRDHRREARVPDKASQVLFRGDQFS